MHEAQSEKSLDCSIYKHASVLIMQTRKERSLLCLQQMFAQSGRWYARKWTSLGTTQLHLLRYSVIEIIKKNYSH